MGQLSSYTVRINTEASSRSSDEKEKFIESSPRLLQCRLENLKIVWPNRYSL